MSKYVIKVDVNGEEKNVDVVGNNSLTPVAVINGKGYFHKFETKDLDKNNQYYDLEGNPYQTEPALPYVRIFRGATKSWRLISGNYQQYGSCEINISNENNNVIIGEQTIYEVEPNTHIPYNVLNAQYFSAGYCEVDEEGNGTFYYNLAGEEFIGEPASVEELNAKQDKLTAGNGITISDNVISAEGLYVVKSDITLKTLLEALGLSTSSVDTSVEKAFLCEADISYTGAVKINKGYCLIKGVAGSPNTYQISSINASYDGGLNVVFLYGITLDNLNSNLSRIGSRQTLTLPSVATLDTSKTYVLKRVGWTTQWVEETAS